MYVNHSKIPLTFPDTQKIWRYLSFEKFKSLIEDSSLFFCRIDGFWKDGDKWEGLFPIQVIEKFKLAERSLPSNDGWQYTFLEWHRKKEAPSHLINCWHANDAESYAMWKLYTKYDNLSIAIQSSIGRLKQSFDATEERILIGEVEYIDFRNKNFENRFFNIDMPNTLKTFLFKWHYFKFENEIRAILNKAYKKHRAKKGILVKIDLTKLVDCIYLSPTSSEEDEIKIKDFLRQNDYSFAIQNSDLGMNLYM